MSDRHPAETALATSLESEAVASAVVEVPAPRASRSRPGRELRNRIVDKATALFATRGFAGTSMREVAQGAGCTKPALYYYFDSKADLFLAIIREETERLRTLIEVPMRADTPLKQRLQTTMEAYFDHVRREPLTLTVLIRAELHVEHGQPTFDFRSVRQMHRDTLMGVLSAAADCGELRKDINLDDLLATLIGVVDYRCTRWLMDREPIPEDFPARIIALLFEGVKP